LDELLDALWTAAARQIVEKERAVDVDDFSARIPRSRGRKLLQRRVLACEGRRASGHAVLGALESSDPGEPRLVINGEPLDHPARLVNVREKQRIAAENCLADPPDSPGAVEMKDVGELVGDYERVPVLVV